MNYLDKIINHEGNEEFAPFKEAIANISFSHSDLIELKDILDQFHPNLWAMELLKNINETLEKL